MVLIRSKRKIFNGPRKEILTLASSMQMEAKYLEENVYDDCWIEDDDHIANEAINYFKHLFT